MVPYPAMNPYLQTADKAVLPQVDQLGYAQRLEANYKKRIEDILTPIIGQDGVRAQVSADMDVSAAKGSRKAGIKVSKLSIAVVIDNRQIHNGEVMTRRPLSEAELDRITGLVKDAVGFDEKRGDTLNVLNAAFSSTLPQDGQGESLRQQDWLWDLVRKLTGVLLGLLVLFGILKPVLKELLNKGRDLSQILPPEVLEHLEATDFSLSGPERAAQLRRQAMQDQIRTARELAVQDPRRVAQVLRSWMGSR
jgi:flagellar M-ring protein FliF